MTSWRERLRLVNPTVARDAALHGLPDQIGDLSPVAVVRNDINDTSGRVWAQVRSELVSSGLNSSRRWTACPASRTSS